MMKKWPNMTRLSTSQGYSMKQYILWYLFVFLYHVADECSDVLEEHVTAIFRVTESGSCEPDYVGKLTYNMAQIPYTRPPTYQQLPLKPGKINIIQLHTNHFHWKGKTIVPQ